MRLRKRAGAHRRLNATLNLTPLIDVVFQLLLFFMLSSNFILQPGIQVDLPKAQAVTLQEREDLILTISRDHELFLNEQRVTLAQLPNVLLERTATRANKTLFIRPDKHVETGLLVEAMGIAKSIGIDSIGIATDPVTDAEK